MTMATDNHNAPSPRRLLISKLSVLPSVLRWCVSFAIAIVLWEFCARVLVANNLFFTPLSDIAVRTVELWSTGELQNHIYVSFIEFAGGFALAVALGILLGVVLAEFPLIRGLVDPWVSMLYATPIIALGPLFILWLGIGVISKSSIVFLVAVFPILINTVSGLTTTDKVFIEVAESFGANAWQIYVKVRMPAALPFIIAGLRLGVARALVGVVVAELFGARAGLGFLILNSAQSFDTAGVFVGVIILAIAGVLSVELLKWLEFKLAPWRHQESDE
jgi:ABC-type nitrate/sulfonate/bicarbonate transport system permease component